MRTAASRAVGAAPAVAPLDAGDRRRWAGGSGRVTDVTAPERRIRTRGAWTEVRRFTGPLADEIFAVCRPDPGIADPGRQAEVAYAGLRDALSSEGVVPEAIVCETVFLRRIRRDLEAACSARARVLGGARRPATTYVEQPPVDRLAAVEVAAVAVRPRSHASSSMHDVVRAAACACEACAPGVQATVVRLGDQATVYVGDVFGSGRDAAEEAYDMFRVADGALAEAAMRFGDVMRTWIHVRDIGRDYGALNQARHAFFRDRGIARRPASTGVQGVSWPSAHRFSLSLVAIRSSEPLDVTPMTTPFLNEAWSYGADFSRGLRIVEANKVTLYVSGTASVDEAGRTAHVGDLAAQADRMLDNVASLLARQRATFDDLVSGVVYLKHAHYAPRLRSLLRKRGFGGFPCPVVEAPLCRPELLCETEAVALLPAVTLGA